MTMQKLVSYTSITLNILMSSLTERYFYLIVLHLTCKYSLLTILITVQFYLELVVGMGVVEDKLIVDGLLYRNPLSVEAPIPL